ncbi:hypothetical protein D1007_46270 [Hordeum vulgare]|nr:hypothetical protein D1007_46270 [Hordeum vulgare]
MYIQLIGLGGLLKTPSIKIGRVLCVAIANSYDAEQDAFIINGRPCRITLEDVEHITGMPCDGKKHIPSNLDDNMELWKKLKDRNDTKITLKVLLAKMKGDSSPNFVRPFVLYTIGKYLTLDHLMASVRKFVNGEANLEGNLPLLQKWRVHQLDSTILYASRLRPLIQNWSEEKAKKVDNIIQNNYVGVGEYVEDLMRPFIPAQDGTLAKPKIGAQNPFNRWIKHHSVKATGSREPEEPRAFTDEDSHDGSFQKQQEVVDAAIDLMRHDEPTDTRDGQLVFIERVAGIIKLKRDGRIEKCYQDALAGIPETTQGTSYLKHDMVFLPTRSSNVHWFLVVVNPKRKEFSALYMLKNIELFTGEKLRM